MPIQRGYRIYEPSNPLSPNPSTDTLIKTLVEGTDYTEPTTSINWTETLVNSIYLNAGSKEYRYIVPFDDENSGTPSSVFNVLNLVPPSDLSATSTQSDEVTLSFTNISGANSYKVWVRNTETNQTVESTLPLDKIIQELNDSTLYEFKVASINVNGDITEYSNIVSATTLALFLLYASVSERQVQWTWDYQVDGNTNHFELRTESDELVANTGLTTEYLQTNISTESLRYIVRVVNNDLSIRESRVVQADVYNDFTDNIGQQELFKYENVIRNASKIGIENNYTINNATRNGIFTEGLSLNLATYDTIYNTLTYQGATNFSIYNNLKNDYILYQECINNTTYIIDVSTNTEIYTPYSFVANYNIGNVNDYKEILKIYPMFSRNYTNLINTIGTIHTTYNYRIATKDTIYNDIKVIGNMNLGVANNLKTNYAPPKFGFANNMIFPLGRMRDAYYNGINPVEIKHNDIIWNEIQKKIDYRLEVNRVRVLCLGDSITAGQPLYDPRYGGTPWVADLISGKFKTNNNYESQYPYWLQLKLGIEDYEVINEGTGRQTSAQVLYSLPNLINTYKPQFVIVLIGTNDLWDIAWKSEEVLLDGANQALANLRQIAQKIIDAGAKPIFGTNLPRDSYIVQTAKDTLKIINQGIKNLGVEMDFDVIDWYEAFLLKEYYDGEWTDNGKLNPQYSDDATHPNVRGYKMMADKINLGIFTSFRADFRVFKSMLGQDVDVSSEEPRVTPNRYTNNYTLTLPIMRRLQSYTINRYIKNLGNSWGMYKIEVVEDEDIVYIWNDITKEWGKSVTGQLAPNDIFHLKLKFMMPSMGKYKNIQLKLSYVEFRR